MNDGSIGVVGAGTMGAGIAQVIAQAGTQVLLIDQSREVLEHARGTIQARLSQRVSQERMTQEDLNVVMERLQPATTLADLAGCRLIIEAVFEEAGVKDRVFQELSSVCPAETVLASNTSTIPITRLGSAVEHPERFMGLHFFNPPYAMRLVEVIRGYHTSDEVVQTGVEFVQSMGKTSVVVTDSPGFVANRMLVPMINEAAFLLQSGIASREDIDTAMKLGANHPMGPLELADLIGLDVLLNVIEVLHEELGEAKYRPAPLLKQMVRAGALGRKTGRGFYEYARG